MTLLELNTLDNQKAYQWFESCCAAPRWCSQMVAQRPFETAERLHTTAFEIWQGLNNSDYLQAFEAHPMIGDINTLKKKYASTSAVAKNEQAGAALADEKTLFALQTLNKEYLEKNGFIFIICATGLSAKQMLQELKKRIKNGRKQEIQIAAAQQMMITKIRINKQLNLTDQGLNT
ncbi:2-oxo-4-hydroxy-4-carboxy-5-ureidoimidazoline decarboxylase [Aliiglaciecola sp. M165]|uniref:2-oxo-4-hydroxy-4-carboxy-5-ureidoimidazoline decarboxylase n=1 Tax=Aliiglaciecola sp. M165 TaxID=2593649 RepID=UPI001180BD5E|nr:2-oxo-4-hydroxy-4-carboxy-5-ureidoimidazoline decarboxylase [Aliiglaciecola sp. M165]TRY30139.1 2-oxo-4-hydroxy-4-carboxy-5-ureidoimidazoline decarboxylase [Aliiglaciecola sp. M165]